MEKRRIRPAERRLYFGVPARSQEPVAVLRFALRGLRSGSGHVKSPYRVRSIQRARQPLSGHAGHARRGVREHYEVPQKMSHELFVLLMQMNEKNTGAARRGAKADTLSKRQSVG